jgi:hypothetical protein
MAGRDQCAYDITAVKTAAKKDVNSKDLKGFMSELIHNHNNEKHDELEKQLITLT